MKNLAHVGQWQYARIIIYFLCERLTERIARPNGKKILTNRIIRVSCSLRSHINLLRSNCADHITIFHNLKINRSDDMIHAVYVTYLTSCAGHMHALIICDRRLLLQWYSLTLWACCESNNKIYAFSISDKIQQ